ncbi:MAG: nucleotidyltransferase domain-containing protein [Clostridia bacterium]|nr:nucleotidyltransferase domain-containing protein [Clostridia bacterium]
MCEKNTLKLVLDEAARGLRGFFGDKLECIILYGSYARGDYDDESDIDVMALVNMDRDELASYRRQVCDYSCDLDLKYDVVISIKLQDKATFDRWSGSLPFFRNVKRDGVFVYG